MTDDPIAALHDDLLEAVCDILLRDARLPLRSSVRKGDKAVRVTMEIRPHQQIEHKLKYQQAMEFIHRYRPRPK